jgi:hypothetical protein
MIPFITYREKDKSGVLQYYVLQKEYPHFVGIISSIPISGTWQSPIAGHNLWVVFNGTLRGNLIPAYQKIGDDIQASLDNMAAWFYNERIKPDEKKYSKFKIKSNVQITTQ